MVRSTALACMLSGLCSSAADLDVTSALQTQQSPKGVDDQLTKQIKQKTYQAGLPAEFAGSKMMLLSNIHHGFVNVTSHDYDCTTYPWMCEEPFRCESWERYDTLQVVKYGISNRSGTNVRSWCLPGLENYAEYAKECLVTRDLRAAATALYTAQSAAGLDNIDASYCFFEGHCSNKLVTDDTPPNDADLMCDYRFQHKHWVMNFNSVLKKIFDNTTYQPTLITIDDGLKSQRLARQMTKFACAQGTYHCDVMYCKHTYCSDTYYVNKFKKYLPAVSGEKIRDFDELPKGADLAY